MRTSATENRSPCLIGLALGAALVAMAALTLGLPGGTGRGAATAQAPRVEQHEGEFVFGRFERAEDKESCEKIIGFRAAQGKISFELDETSGAIRGAFIGGGVSDTQLDDERLGQIVGCGPRAIYPGRTVPQYPRYYSFKWAGQIQATFSGSWDPATGAIVMEGTARAMWGVRFLKCEELGRRIDCPGNGGGAVEVPIRMTGTRGSSSAEGGNFSSLLFSSAIEFPGTLGITVGRWRTEYAPLPAPSPSPTPSLRPTASPAPTAPPGPTPPGVCTDCNDEEWANQQAENWAVAIATDGRICTPGATCVRPTAGQIAAAKEQLRTCLVQTMAAERAKPAAQQRTRTQVYVECRQKLPIQVPFG